MQLEAASGKEDFGFKVPYLGNRYDSRMMDLALLFILAICDVAICQKTGHEWDQDGMKFATDHHEGNVKGCSCCCTT